MKPRSHQSESSHFQRPPIVITPLTTLSDDDIKSDYSFQAQSHATDIDHSKLLDVDTYPSYDHDTLESLSYSHMSSLLYQTNPPSPHSSTPSLKQTISMPQLTDSSPRARQIDSTRTQIPSPRVNKILTMCNHYQLSASHREYSQAGQLIQIDHAHNQQAIPR
ncbi:hypothetical protein BLNAU_20166 [Blattamonas nauphoetae]|uniref:Uncharacterized protein n=1 Tax=Blattamonas nauphoetae TaxID=2049346 RepID=A0ABQ9X028_9EUKA|nr:hypothetical protein BLNAU_20166 [Blattamonas nauphoetae]